MDNKLVLSAQLFQEEEEIVLENSNYHKVKIMIMHTGENLNGSVFSEESIDKSIPTISNIPILGYVKKDEGSENKDFAGHETDFDIFTDEDGKIKIREYYKEIPIGVIPESNDFFKEEIDGEIYLGCYGYIWKCYSNDAYDILLEDEEKEVSMEILIKECSYDRKNRCNINKFEFLGVTVLGAKVPGAMGSDCTINMNFSMEDENNKKEFSEAVDKLNKFLQFQRKEGVDMEGKDPVQHFEDEEVCDKCGKNPCECENKEELEEKEDDKKKENCSEKEDDKTKDKEDDKEDNACKKKNNASEEDNEDEDEKDSDETDDTEDDKEKEDNACKKKNHSKENKEDFSLSLNNIFKSIRKALEEYTYEYISFWGDIYECRKYWADDLIPNDNIAIIYDCEDGENYGVTYSLDNDDVVLDLDNKELYIKEWRARESGASSKFEVAEKDDRNLELYNKIAEEHHELKVFKEEIEAEKLSEKLNEDIENVLSNFEFSKEETSELVEKTKKQELDIDMFETMLYALEAKKNRANKEKFSKNDTSEGLNVTDRNEEAPKGKYQHIIDEYGRK